MLSRSFDEILQSVAQIAGESEPERLWRWVREAEVEVISAQASALIAQSKWNRSVQRLRELGYAHEVRPSTPRPLRREFRDDGATADHRQLPTPAPPPPAGNRCAATS